MKPRELNDFFSEDNQRRSGLLENLITQMEMTANKQSAILPVNDFEVVRKTLKSANIVESRIHKCGSQDMLMVPDVDLKSILSAVDGGADDVFHEAENGPLTHYHAFTGLATPCMRMGGEEGLLAFRPEFSMPFRGKELTWERLARFHGRGRG